MRVYERLNKMVYDEIDMRNMYSKGFWIGAVSGAVTVFAVCILVGLYVA